MAATASSLAPPAPKLSSARPGNATQTEGGNGVSGGLARIGGLTQTMSRQLDSAFAEIQQINLRTRLLSINAQIEAARAGEAGATFGVVAGEMASLAQCTTESARRLDLDTRNSINSMIQTIQTLGSEIRGTRLSDLAMTNIDLIDRNLYERSCDVRWWATDSSMVEALQAGDDDATLEYASRRLGEILDAYTVYFDIVLCDLNGRVVANGRPGLYDCKGSQQKETAWFQAALQTRDGTQFGFQTVHRNPSLATGQHILVYSCAVREGGETRGRPLGVIGIVFNWESLAQTIVNKTLISPEEKPFTRVCIVDEQGLVLADSHGKLLTEKLALPNRQALFALKKGHLIDRLQGTPHILAHAFSPGYETYATGWHSLILQKLEMPATLNRATEKTNPQQTRP